MRIAFDDIPVTGLEVSNTDTSWVPAEEVACVGPVTCTARLERDGERVLVEGTMRLDVLLSCDRCLGEYTYCIDTTFAVDLEWVAGEEDLFAPEHGCGESEMDVMMLEEPVVDMDSIWQQQLFLSLPEKRLCSEGCAGLCPSCGENLNRGQCGCAQAKASSPFGVLAKLKGR